MPLFTHRLAEVKSWEVARGCWWIRSHRPGLVWPSASLQEPVLSLCAAHAFLIIFLGQWHNTQRARMLSLPPRVWCRMWSPLSRGGLQSHGKNPGPHGSCPEHQALKRPTFSPVLLEMPLLPMSPGAWGARPLFTGLSDLSHGTLHIFTKRQAPGSPLCFSCVHQPLCAPRN